MKVLQRLSVLTRALILAVLVLAGVNAWLHFGSGASAAEERIRQVSAARETASETIPFVLSYRSTNLADYGDGVERRTAGTFRDEFRDLLPQLTQRAEDKQLVLQAEVSSLAEVKVSDGKVTLLAFVNQSTQESGSTTPTVQGVRLEVVMEWKDGDWVLTSMTPV